jgi:hypothetical protein
MHESSSVLERGRERVEQTAHFFCVSFRRGVFSVFWGFGVFGFWSLFFFLCGRGCKKRGGLPSFLAHRPGRPGFSPKKGQQKKEKKKKKGPQKEK